MVLHSFGCLSKQIHSVSRNRQLITHEHLNKAFENVRTRKYSQNQKQQFWHAFRNLFTAVAAPCIDGVHLAQASRDALSTA